jgi:Ca2+-binding EF-hand superfamily protein
MGILLRRHVLTAIAAGFTALVATTAHAQSKIVERFDVNKDGKVSRSEIPEGPTRRMFDNLVEKYKLDPNKTYTIQEFERATDMATSSSSSSPSNSSSGYSNGNSRNGNNSRRSFGGPGFTFGTSGSSRPGSSGTRAPSDGRPFRALEELPDAYKSYDKDGDGQIGLYEWPRDRIREFVALDTNDDGFLTINELRGSSSPPGGSRDFSRDRRPESRPTPPESSSDQ